VIMSCDLPFASDSTAEARPPSLGCHGGTPGAWRWVRRSNCRDSARSQNRPAGRVRGRPTSGTMAGPGCHPGTAFANATAGFKVFMRKSLISRIFLRGFMIRGGISGYGKSGGRLKYQGVKTPRWSGLVACPLADPSSLSWTRRRKYPAGPANSRVNRRNPLISRIFLRGFWKVEAEGRFRRDAETDPRDASAVVRQAGLWRDKGATHERMTP
jgi:hypothetical protein